MYTYAFCRTPTVALELPSGIMGTLQVVTSANLAAIVEPDLAVKHLQQDDALLVQAVLAHDRVMRLLCQQTTILPLRFGTCFHALPELLDHLQTQQHIYLNQLTQLEGKAEYTLKLTPIACPETAIATDLTGKHYFLAKKQQYQAQLSYYSQQRAVLSQITHAIRSAYPHCQSSESPSEAQSIHVLVARDQEQQLCQQIQTWQQQYPQWAFSLGEALPPYHFATLGQSTTPNTPHSDAQTAH